MVALPALPHLNQQRGGFGTNRLTSRRPQRLAHHQIGGAKLTDAGERVWRSAGVPSSAGLSNGTRRPSIGKPGGPRLEATMRALGHPLPNSHRPSEAGSGASPLSLQAASVGHIGSLIASDSSFFHVWNWNFGPIGRPHYARPHMAQSRPSAQQRMRMQKPAFDRHTSAH